MYLQQLTVRATRSFRRLNKGGKRAESIERYILQYVLMCDKFGQGDNYTMEITGNPEDGIGGLQAFIDAKDDCSSEEGEVFRLIQHKAGGLRRAGRYDLILRALDYVREEYPKSEIE